MSKTNKDQLEAHEINTTPRIVITTEGFMSFPVSGKSLTFNKQQLLCILQLAEGLQKAGGQSEPQTQ